MHTSISISCSPLVIILPIAFRSAQQPNEHAVSMHTPVYIFPLVVNIAAATPPAVTLSEIILLFNISLHFVYNSSQILVSSYKYSIWIAYTPNFFIASSYPFKELILSIAF